MAQVVIITDLGTAGVGGFMRSAGAYRVATELRSHGYSVQVIDHFSKIVLNGVEPMKPLIEKFVDEDTLVFGLSSTFFTNIRPEKRKGDALHTVGLNKVHSIYGVPTKGFPIGDDEMAEIFSWVKARSRKVKFVMGGAKTRYLSAPGVNIFMHGYADQSFVELLKYLEGKNPFFQFHKTKSGAMIIDSSTGTFDFNRSQILWDKADLIRPGEALPIEVSRGCIFRCKFCSYPLNGKKKLDYIKDPGVLREEFTRNYELYSTTHYMYMDDTHNDTTQKLEMLYNEVYSKLPFKINFYSYARIDLLEAHPEQMDLLLASGYRGAFFGIESLNEDSMRAIGKGMKPEKMIDFIYRLKAKWKQNIPMYGSFIIGLPHESQKTAKQWLDWLVSYDNPFDGINILPFFLMPVRKNVDLNEIELNYSKYGYKFDTTLDEMLGNWKNAETGLTFLEALEIRNYYMPLIKPENKKIGSFGIASHINLGYKLEDILTLPSAEVIKDDDLDVKIKLLTQEYYQNLLNL